MLSYSSVQSFAAIGVPINWSVYLLAVFSANLRQHLILLPLGQLEVLLAKEPEPRPLRPVLAGRIAAAHVSLGAARSPGSSVAACLRQCGRDSLGEHLGEAFNQRIEWDWAAATIRAWITSASLSATSEVPPILFGPVRADPFTD